MQVTVNEPIRVLHLKSPMVRGGSIEKIILSLAAKSPRAEWTHHVGLLQTSLIYGRGEPSGSDILTPEAIGKELLHSIPWERDRLLVTTFAHLVRLARRERIHILHCHDNRANFLGFLCAKWLALPLVTSIHGWNPVSRKVEWLILLDKAIVTRFDRIVAGSSSLGESLRRRYGSKVVTVTYGIDVENVPRGEEALAVRRKLNISADAIVVATILRLSPEKGHKYLLEALPGVVRDFPAVKVLIVGEGPSRRELEELSRALGVKEHVAFTGFYPDAGEIFSIADIVVQPSLRETLSIALLEALAHGKPVVATEVGGASLAVEQGISGLLVPPGQSGALAEALRQVVGDPVLRQRMREAAKRVASDRFGDLRMVTEMLTVYHDLIGAWDVAGGDGVAIPQSGSRAR